MVTVKSLGLNEDQIQVMSEELKKVHQEFEYTQYYSIEQVYEILKEHSELFKGCVVTSDTNNSFVSLTTLYVQKIVGE